MDNELTNPIFYNDEPQHEIVKIVSSPDEIQLFIDNFKLIYESRLYIGMNPEYANIVLSCFGKSLAYFGRCRPVTLGEILYHYEHGRWTVNGACCGTVRLFHIAGSVFSGNNLCAGFCETCHTIKYKVRIPHFASAWGALLDYQPKLPYAPTEETISSMLKDLETLASRNRIRQKMSPEELAFKRKYVDGEQ